MCWIGAARKASASSLEERLAGGAVVGEDAHLDQPVGIEGGLDLAPHGGGRAVVADGDDRVEVMGFGALLLALGGSQEEGGHAPIIGAP